MSQQLYRVQRITRMKQEKGKRWFRIKWFNYPSQQNTWEPQEHLHKAMVQKFMQEEQIRLLRREARQIIRQERKNNPKQDKTFKIMSLNTSQDQKSTFNILYQNKVTTVNHSFVHENFTTKLAEFYLQQYLNSKTMLSE